MLNKMIIMLCEYLMSWCEKRGRVLKITGSQGPDDVYLIRYYLFQSRWCNIFLHQFLRSDKDDLHDHPWDFVTYLVRGSYKEQRWNEDIQSVQVTKRSNYMYDDYMHKVPLRENTLVFRRATDQHRVVVNKDLKEKDKDQAALTFFISGPTKREWGFIKEETIPSGKLRIWTPWREYLGLPPDTPGRG
jgi:hypothetical protein